MNQRKMMPKLSFKAKGTTDYISVKQANSRLSDEKFKIEKMTSEMGATTMIKTPIILICGVLSIPLGLHLLVTHDMLLGGFLIITVAPCLFLYPLIRFLFFGGKDSVAAVVTTVVVEEVTKSAITNSLKDRQKKKTMR